MSDIEKAIEIIDREIHITEDLDSQRMKELNFALKKSKEAIEKQTPKKPIKQFYAINVFDSGTDYLCPKCKSLVGTYSDCLEDWLGQKKHCEDCGQEIDWQEASNG